MNTALILFISTFVLVLALGLQSQLVNNGHFAGAFFNSLMISFGQIGAFGVIKATTPWEYAGYILGGPIGIITSMYLYRKFWKRGA